MTVTGARRGDRPARRRPSSRPAVALTLALVGLTACGHGGIDSSVPGPTFKVGTITFQVNSTGLEHAGSEVTFWLTDRPNTCLAIQGTPVLTTTFFKLRVAPPSSGSSASVVPGKLTLAPGEAFGSLELRTGTHLDAAYTATSGTVSWSLDAQGHVTLEAFDVGFDGTPDRMVGGGLILATCN